MELEGDFFRFSRPVRADRVRSRLFGPARALDVCFISARSGFQAPFKHCGCGDGHKKTWRALKTLRLERETSDEPLLCSFPSA